MAENPDEPYHGVQDFSAQQHNRFAMPKIASAYADDMRISKILRRLMMEMNPQMAVELCKNLEVAVRSPSNTAYICRSFGSILESLITVLRQCPQQCLEDASFVLGLIGYINHAAFQEYKTYLLKAYRSYERIRKYIAIALRITFSYDAVNLELLPYGDELIGILKDFLENVESADVFMCLTETILEFSRNYKYSFENNFTDIVDIVVGWHLEMDQPLPIKVHCSMVLQQLAQYFYVEFNFTIDLMGQFLEDIITLSDELASTLEFQTDKDVDLLVQRMGTFVGVFNSILKALYTKEYVDLNACEAIVKASFDVLMKSATLLMAHVCHKVETVVNINEFICLILLKKSFTHLADLVQIEQVIQSEITYLKHFNDDQELSLMYTILAIVREYRTSLPCSMVALIFQPDGNMLHEARWKTDSRQYKLLLKIYQEVLLLKNVPLLQEAYKHITRDMKGIIQFLETADKENCENHEIMRASVGLTFHLTALAALAMQTSSIIGMYALYPSILELLINNCQSTNMEIWSKYSTLHTVLLQVLITHATKNHYFLSTSRLFIQEEKNSRTSENYTLILKFLADILSRAEQVGEHILKMLLTFSKELCDESQTYAVHLKDNTHLVNICKSLPKAVRKAPIECAAFVEALLNYSCLHVDSLKCIRNIAVSQLDSIDGHVKEMYTRIYAKLPLDITLMHLKEVNANANEATKMHELQQWYRSTMKCSIRDKHFKEFLEGLNVSTSASAANETSLQQLCENNFFQSWVIQLNPKAMDFQRNAYANGNMTELWMQYEAARYCVRNKLRTIIGKPLETFLAIEGIINMYARLIVGKPTTTTSLESKLEVYAEIRKNARMLLGFYENLEKLIYNATEGTAFAYTPLEKASSSFFRINAHTCHEWFKRVRNSVNVVAQFSSQFDMVIRLSETILKAGSLSDMDQCMISLVWALINSKEDDTLLGLHVWCRTRFGKRYAWLQCTSEQVAGRREKAFECYVYFLRENEAELSDKLKEFIFDQMLECLYFTGQWTRMREIYNRQEEPNTNLLNLRSSTNLAVFESHMQGIAAADINSAFQDALMQLTDWSHLGKVKESAITSNFSANVVRKLENDYVNYIVNPLNAQMPTKANGIITFEIQECMRLDCTTRVDESLADYIILNYITQQQQQGTMLNRPPQLISTNCEAAPVVPSTILTKCLFWQALTGTPPLHHPDSANSLYLDVALNARLEGNHNYCRMMLERFFAAKGYEANLVHITERLQEQSDDLLIEDNEMLRGYAELTKYMFNKYSVEAINLASDFCAKIVKQQQNVGNAEHRKFREIGANMLLTLADWLGQRGHNSASGEPSQQLQILLNVLHSHESVSISDNPLIPPMEKVVGKLISGSIYQMETSAEAWCAFGNWCYRWGKKIMESKNADSATANSTLTAHDLTLIRGIVGNDISETKLKQLVDILNSHQLHVYDEGLEEDIEATGGDTNSTELIEFELRKIEPFTCMPVEQISNIIKIWRKAYKNIFTHYEMATDAYFKYLAIQNSDATCRNSDGEDIEDSTLVTITLRLLRLIAKHAIGLQDVLEEGLKSTPLRPWRIIIPQLFSRLNHHEPYVRKSVSELLCRLAKAQPDLIIFPVIVGAEQELKAGRSQQAAMEISGEPKTTMTMCFNSLLGALSSQAPDTVLHVRLLIKELKRITLLWEEYWLHSLGQLYNEYSAHFVGLDAELKKCQTPSMELVMSVKEKYELTMRHLIGDFEKICQVTDKPAETNYERCFQERFGAVIRSTHAQLKKPLDLSKPNENWLSIKQLYTIIQKRPLRGTSSSMKLNDLSPILGSMQDSAISMPGVDTYGNEQNVYIKSVDSIVYVLPTKTKPKKLSFYGSNGKKYSYLFKGLEDLHLDERIMQFLSISNSMMARSSELQYNEKKFKALHYSVIPLGPQSGMISWVDGVVPLFSIYKKWQQRQLSFKESNKTANPDPSAVNIGPTRPSELFYNKLGPLLAEQNIKLTDPRKMWPLSILRRVLKELADETPNDLLAKELWCSALTAVDWRKSIRNYTASVAVMSVIGYVIGLGDRHLDNVLIKLSTGEIVHIDYNVCFEKGKTLRVPEKVPFRMTRNFIEAMGITGIEGGFRIGCEKVLKILRKERETLLTLLEAFVYDPLVDWTVNDDDKAIKNRIAIASSNDFALTSLNPLSTRMEHKPNTDLFNQKNINSKLDGIKKYWQSYNDDMQLQLSDVFNGVQNMLLLLGRLNKIEQNRTSISKQSALIRELESLGPAIGSHTLNTLTLRYNAWKKNADMFESIKGEAEQSLWDINQIVDNYVSTLSEESFDRLLKYKTELTANHNTIEKPILTALRENAQAILKAFDTELYTAFDGHIDSLKGVLVNYEECALTCIGIVHEYTEVMHFHPTRRLLKKQTFAVQQKLKCLLENTAAVDEKYDEEIANQTLAGAEQYAKGMKNVWTELKSNLNDVVTKWNQNRRSTSIAETQGHIQRLIEAELQNKALVQYTIEGILKKIFQEGPFSKDNEESYCDACAMLYQQIIFLHSMKHLLVQCKCFDNFETICNGSELLWSSLVSVDKIKMAFDDKLLKRVICLFMSDDKKQLQDELLTVCYQLDKETRAKITTNELLQFLEDFDRLYEDFAIHMIEVFRFVHANSDYKSLAVAKFVLDHKSFAEYMERLKYQTLSSVFAKTQQLVKAFNENDSNAIFDVRIIVAPLDNFIVTLEREVLCGLTSAVYSDVIRRIAQPLDLSVYDDYDVCLAQDLCNDLYTRLQCAAYEGIYMQQLLRHQRLLHYTKHIASAHYWLNEQHFADKDSDLKHEHIILKAKLLEPLKGSLENMSTLKNEIAKQFMTFESFKAKIISTVESSTFELLFEYIEHERLHMEDYLEMSGHLLYWANALHKFEMSWSVSDAEYYTMLPLKWQASYKNLEQSSALITPEEKAIVQLLDPEGKVTQYWIDNVNDLLDEMTFTLQRDLESLKSQEKSFENVLSECNKQFELLIAASIRLDIRSLLKLILKNEKQYGSSRDSGNISNLTRHLQTNIKWFFSTLTELQQILNDGNYTTEILLNADQKIKDLVELGQQNYKGLNDLMQDVSLTQLAESIETEAEVKIKANNSEKSSLAGLAVEQKRNAYAVSVWKRIRIKLEGRDPDSNHRATVPEQIDYIIQEATNVDNLAVLYEGWTPWV